jgi:hypothetical protein
MPTFRYDVMPFSPGAEVSLEIEDTALPRNLRIWLPSHPAPYPRRTEFSATPGNNRKTPTEATRHKIVTMAKHPNNICVQYQFHQFSYFTISETVFSFVNDQSESWRFPRRGDSTKCVLKHVPPNTSTNPASQKWQIITFHNVEKGLVTGTFGLLSNVNTIWRTYVTEYVATIQSYPQETFQGHCGLFSATKFVTVHDLVRMSDNIAQSLAVEVAAVAVVSDVHF